VKRPPAVVLVSGGMDSAVVLAIAIRSGFSAWALSFNYGQRHHHELRAAARVCKALGAARHVVLDLNLRAFGGSALTDDEIDVPKDQLAPERRERRGGKEGKEGKGGSARRGISKAGPARTSKATPRRESDRSPIPLTYVPARNTIFLSCALGLAESIDSRHLYIGVNAVDYSGYPDCRPAFIRAFERMANLATRAGVEDAERPRDPHFRIHAPLLRMGKAEIVRAGGELGVDFGLTHTCYDPRPRGKACGHCDACLLRARGFADAGLRDPGV